MDSRQGSRKTIPTEERNKIGHDRGPTSRSWTDRRLIVTTIKRDRGVFWSKFEAKFTANSGASKLPKGIAPTTLANRLHDRSNDPRSLGQFPSLKACISLLCSSTFDRFVKELSEFRRRSLLHRDPPAFRLDCEAIGAGLITNCSLISLNFPLNSERPRGRI